ncbi:hypothetical protein M1L60_03930 [Actinoplanes sp. TRM 88003]|uniref:Protein arginine N-methyltransferase 1 n=1 Tax=Paractinoplanes aksuensis TaxID=2939490 RepID=A0ABT1DFX0_9ACTN|nr:hypothetical protein [Actinoplanes aksuensis]MCO8269739.1 hypothetical protein [Actinoplanes aksuensis]
MGEYPVYDDGVYDAFDVRDERFRAYSEAIAGAAAGRVVLDIGTGRDALWAVAAARAGAAHVYAVERQPDAAAQARRTVSGLGGRVTVIEGLSTAVDLPTRAGVCVSEIVGNIASAEGAVTVLADARQRLCTTDCLWIPFRVQTWAAAVSLPAGGRLLASESLPYVEKVFAAVGRPFDLRLCLGGPAADLVISSAAPVESLVFDHRRPPPDADGTATARLTVDVDSARMTGLLLWSRIAVSSAASSREIDSLTGDTRGWAPVYVPLDPTEIRSGDHLEVTFHRRTSDDGIHPDYHVSVLAPSVEEPLVWSSPHHGGVFHESALHRELFPS